MEKKNELQVFTNEEFGELQVILIEGKEYFGATNTAKLLGYSNPHDAIVRHCRKDGVVKHEVIDSLGRKQEINAITEGNLYRLISKSQLPNAEKFESWVFDTVLPTLRKTGGYISNSDLMVNTYFGSLDDNYKMIVKGLFSQIENQQRQLEEAKPLITFAETCLKSKDNILMRELAKIANDEGIEIGQNRLYNKLREWKMIMGKPSTEPYQTAMTAGYFVYEEKSVETAYGTRLVNTTKVTPKGQVFIIEKLKKEMLNN